MHTGTAEDLMNLPKGSMLSVCGAGGKTGLIHELRDRYLALGRKVLVTTSTHMMNEGSLLQEESQVAAVLAEKGYAFAGIPDPQNPLKIIGLRHEIIRRLAGKADLTLIEADGARHQSFKVPYPHEPVIVPGTTLIAVVYARSAAGQRICDCTYNAEGAAKILHTDIEAVLDENMIQRAISETYFRQFERQFPGIPVCMIPRG